MTPILSNHDFKRDLRWFSTFLHQYNGVSFYDHIRTQHVAELDVCLLGIVGHWENLVHHLPLCHHYRNLDIVQLEMINILVAIHTFLALWHRKSILIRCACFSGECINHWKSQGSIFGSFGHKYLDGISKGGYPGNIQAYTRKSKPGSGHFVQVEKFPLGYKL